MNLNPLDVLSAIWTVVMFIGSVVALLNIREATIDMWAVAHRLTSRNANTLRLIAVSRLRSCLIRAGTQGFFLFLGIAYFAHWQMPTATRVGIIGVALSHFVVTLWVWQERRAVQRILHGAPDE